MKSPRHTPRLALVLSLLVPLVSCGGDGGSPRNASRGDGGSMDSAAAPMAAVGMATDGSFNGATNGATSGSARSLEAPVVSAQAAPEMAAPPAPASMGAVAADRSVKVAELRARTSVSAPVAEPAMVIRSGQASLEVDSLVQAVASVQRIASSLGGYLGNTWMATGSDQVRRATIELKIPAARYEEAVSGLAPIGKVESVTSSAEDVGEEFTDLTARIANAHRLEERLVQLLAERTGRLQDALMVERELARVREEIERYEGRTRYLGARVAVSTLSVQLHEKIPIVADNPGHNVLVEAAKDAWRNFVALLALAIESLGVLLPVGVIVALVYASWRRRRPSNAV